MFYIKVLIRALFQCKYIDTVLKSSSLLFAIISNISPHQFASEIKVSRTINQSSRHLARLITPTSYGFKDDQT